MATTTQLISSARAKLLEATSEILSQETILMYANFAHEDIIKRTFPNKGVATALVSLTNGVGVLPSDFGTLYGNAYVNDSYTFAELSIADFARNPLGSAVCIENETLKVFPVDTAQIYIKYYKTYPVLSAVQNPTIDSYYHELIIYGIMYRALEDLQDEQLSKYYRDKYESEFTIKRSAVSQYEEDNQRGGQMFTYTQLL